MKMVSMSVRLAVLALVFASGCCCPGRCYNSCFDPCGSMGSCASLSPCGGCGGCNQCGGTGWDDTCDWTMDCIDNSVGSVGNQCGKIGYQCGKMRCKFRSNCQKFWAALNSNSCGCDQCSSNQCSSNQCSSCDSSFNWLSQSGSCGCDQGTGGCPTGNCEKKQPMSPPKCQSCQAKRDRMKLVEDDSVGFAHIGANGEIDGEEYVSSDMPPYYPMVPGSPEYLQGGMVPMQAGMPMQGGMMPGPMMGGPVMGGPMMVGAMPGYPPMAPPAEMAMPAEEYSQPVAPGPYPVSTAMPSRPSTLWRAAEKVPAPPVEEDHGLVPSSPISGESPVGLQGATPVGEAEEEFERPLILQQNYEGAPGYGVVPAAK